MNFETTDRRHFISRVGKMAAVTSVAATLPAARTRAGSFTGRIRKAVKFQMIIDDLSTEDKFRMLKDCGFDGVEVQSSLERKKGIETSDLAKASEKTGLPIHGIINSDQPDIQTAIDEAKTLGATSVLHVVRYKSELGYRQNYRETQDILRRAIEHADRKQIHILLENVWASFLIDPMSMARYIDEINSPWVQSYFDIGNVVRWGWPQHWIEVLGPRIKKLDVKEYDLKAAMNTGMRSGFDVPMGKGSIEWNKVRDELTKLDYHGWATAEVRGGDRKRMAEISAQMNEVLDL